MVKIASLCNNIRIIQLDNIRRLFTVIIPTIGRAVAIMRQKLASSIGLPLRKLLPESEIEDALKAEGVRYRKRLYCPIVTIWLFISQVLSADKTCETAVSKGISLLASEGHKIPSPDTSAYCKARQRLKEGVLKRLFHCIGMRLHFTVPDPKLWCGLRVVMVDGSTVSMPDTEENQQEYPQHSNQAKGCGFPIARIVALFSLSCGTVLDALLSALSTHEVVLFRRMWPSIPTGSVVRRELRSRRR